MFHLVAGLLLISIKFSHQIDPLCYKIITTDEIDAAESYFGYAVQLRRSDAGGRVIVGAPRANSTVSEHASLRQPGAVFSCDFDSNCKQYVFDYEADTTHKVSTGFHYKHYKTDGWLGAALDGDDSISGPLMTCSPKWINQYYARQKKPAPYIQSGLCYVLDDARDLRGSAEVLIPLQSTTKIYDNNMYNYAYGEAGISLHYVKDEPSIIIGAPGVMDWRGTIARYTHPFSNKTLKVINRERGVRIDEKYSYFGFSVTSGRFVKSDRWYVSGAPRGADLKGLVYVYTVSDRIEIKHTLMGSEIGEYFGYSVAVVDVDNDKVDEIVIGAPMYSGGNRRADSGRIYHFRIGRHGRFEEVEIVQQFSEKYARVGMAIGGVGDVNDDGYNDVAVGAPFANSGRGAVVIYYGSANGLKLGRTIFSTSVDRDLKGFGIGISRGVDVDNNGIEDFAVGAAFSGHVVVFRMFPDVSGKVELSSTPSEFSVKTDVIKVEACLTISGRHLPGSLTVRSRLWFDDDRFKLETPLQEISIRKATKSCVAFKIAVGNSEPDLIKPLTVNVNFEPVSNDTRGCNPRIFFPSPGQKTLKINYLKGCENENICQSNLIVSGSYDWPKPTLTIGERDKIELIVFVRNANDPAFKTRLYVTLPKFTTLYRVADKCNDFAGTAQRYCFNVGNPLGKNETKKIVLYLKLNMEEMSYDKPLVVKLNATSHQEEVDETDNVLDVVLPFGKEEKLDLIPISQPEVISLTGNAKPSPIKHIVKINNLGPTPIDALKIEIFIPVIVEKRKLLKLLQMKTVLKSYKTGNVDLLCNDDGITPLLLPWDHRKINESAHVNDIIITCDSESLNVDCRKFTCSVERRFLVKDRIEITLPAFIELEKISKIDSNKYIMRIHTRVIVHKSGEQMQMTDIVTVVQRTLTGGFTKWVSAGVVIGLICLAVLTFVLFKLGCFKRKNYTNQGKIVSMNDYEFEEEK